MIYTNLLSFLIVLFILSLAERPATPFLSPWLSLPCFALTLLLFYRIAGQQYQKTRFSGSTTYFATEKKLTLLAVVFFAFSVFAFDLTYYLQVLSLGGSLPVFGDAGGVFLFFLFLILVWLQAAPSYAYLFGKSSSTTRFVYKNVLANLPIILPWFLLSLLFDLLNLLPFPSLHRLLHSSWGNVLVLLPALLFALVFLPVVVWRLWDCSQLPSGPRRNVVESFFQRQNFSAGILHWPLYEGRILTAAVLGFVPRFRYILLTPALLDLLDQEELESVLAHEIGHVRHWHLLLYLLLLLGFSLFVETLSQQLVAVFFSSSWFWQLTFWFDIAAEQLIEYLSGIVLLLLLVLFFRFLFGWFIRNFERQADLYAFRVQESSQPLIRAFEKIAACSGNIRNKKNWHHFGIGQRIDFLARCESQPSLAKLHDRKVWLALASYFLLISVLVWRLPAPSPDLVNGRAKTVQLEIIVEKKLAKEPMNSELLRLRGDLFLEQGKEEAALDAYQKAFQAAPNAAETMNNLAWLLLTVEKKSLRNPDKALDLALAAVAQEKKGYILDTLAVALWAKGRVEEAVQTETEAARLDLKKRAYYQAQAKKFVTQSW